MRLTGHVLRMPDERFSKTLFYGRITGVKALYRRSEKIDTKTTIKASVKDLNMTIESWKQAVQNILKWHGLVNKGACHYEE